MTLEILETAMASWFGFTGDYTLIAMAIIIFFIIALALVGLDVRLSLLFSLPLAYAFTAEGWFSTWFAVIFWILAAGFLFFTIWGVMVPER